MTQSGDELSSEIGRVLAEHQTILYGVDHRARCSCGWVGDTSSWAPTLHRRDALLPVVTAYAERLARERAAEIAARVKAIPTYKVISEDESLGYVVTAGDVLAALTADDEPVQP